jgi:hypothetical protein
MSLKREQQNIVNSARKRGWTVTRTTNGHYRLVSKHGDIVIASGTPSDSNVPKSFAADLRRVERSWGAVPVAPVVLGLALPSFTPVTGNPHRAYWSKSTNLWTIRQFGLSSHPSGKHIVSCAEREDAVIRVKNLDARFKLEAPSPPASATPRGISGVFPPLEDKSVIRGNPHRAYWSKPSGKTKVGNWRIRRMTGKKRPPSCGTAPTRAAAELRILQLDEAFKLAQGKKVRTVVPPAPEPLPTSLTMIWSGIAGPGEDQVRDTIASLDEDQQVTDLLPSISAAPPVQLSDMDLVIELQKRLQTTSFLAGYKVTVVECVRHMERCCGAAKLSDTSMVLPPARYAEVTCQTCKNSKVYGIVSWALGGS